MLRGEWLQWNKIESKIERQEATVVIQDNGGSGSEVKNDQI